MTSSASGTEFTPAPALGSGARPESGPARAGLHVSDLQTARWHVRTHKAVGYEVRLRDSVFDPANRDLLESGPSAGGRLRRFVVIDSTVDRLYGEQVRAYFAHHEVEHRIMTVPAHEGVKDFQTVAEIIHELDSFGISRRSEPVIVIGGGVLMDIVGLAASLYRRGTPFIRVPTTLIGLVDAGVGAKTGVNFNGGKNRLGTYAPAELTLIDRSFLASLDPRHIANGLAEILKIALIKDNSLFELLEKHGRLLRAERFQGLTSDGDLAATAVLRSATHGMLEELQPNLWETELERCVDYGHTFSPTLEMKALPRLLHGEAVCVDMAFTTILAHHRGLVDDEQRSRVFAVMADLGLPTWDSLLDPEMLMDALTDAVRHRDGLQRLPLPVGIGAVTFVNDVDPSELVAALADGAGVAQPTAA